MLRVLALALFLVVSPAVTSAVAPDLGAAAAQSESDDEQPAEPAPGLGNIVGSPDPGPDPEDVGDRGGAAQLALAAVMFGGVVFIGWRISRNVRRT